MMAKKNIIVPLSAFIILVTVSLFFASTQAQKTIPSLVVHPSNFDLNLTPGSADSETITLDNTTSNDLQIRVNLRNFTAQGEEGGVNLTEQNTSYSLVSWISVSPKIT